MGAETMAFRGEIKELGMVGVLQIISQNRKTGELVLADGERLTKLRFSEGMVVGTLHPPEALGAMLVRVGMISEKDLGRALEVQERTLQKLGEALMRLDMISHEDLTDILHLQLHESVIHALEWKEGEFFFESLRIDFDPVLSPRVEIEPLLLEGLRMVDELPMIRRRMGPFDQIVRRIALTAYSSGPGEPSVTDGSGGGEEQFPGSAEVSKPERIIYRLSNGKRSIREIIDLSRLGEFQACEAMISLRGRGEIEFIPAWEGEAGGRKRLDWLGQAAGLILALLFVGLLVLAFVPGSSKGGILQGGPFSSTRYLQLLQRERVERALEIYRIETGTYPAALAELTGAGLLRPEDLAAPWGGKVSYFRKGESYHIITWRGE